MVRARDLGWYNRKIRIICSSRDGHSTFVIRSRRSFPGLYTIETQVFDSLEGAKSALANFKLTLKNSAPKLKQRTLYEVNWLPPDSETWQHRQFRRMKAVRRFVKKIHISGLSVEPADVEMVWCYRAGRIRRKVWWVVDAKGDLVKLAHS